MFKHNQNKQNQKESEIEATGVAENISFEQLVMRQVARIDLLAVTRAAWRDAGLVLNNSGEASYSDAVNHLETSLDSILDEDYKKDIKKMEKKLEEDTEYATKKGYLRYRNGNGSQDRLRAKEMALFIEEQKSATLKYCALIRLMDRNKMLFKHTGTAQL